MYQLRTYQNEELSLLWAGYVETETHVVFFPTGGGEPVTVELKQEDGEHSLSENVDTPGDN